VYCFVTSTEYESESRNRQVQSADTGQIKFRDVNNDYHVNCITDGKRRESLKKCLSLNIV
jgi:hypothetical protein